WLKRLLSYGGRDVFIKSILQALPTYALSIFLAPKRIIENMNSRIRRMWWACKNKDRGWAMMTWDNICVPKGMGGLGFRDLHLFNLALLERQAWRLPTNKDTLCYRVLCSKYFPDGNLFSPKHGDKLSVTWSSIATAVRSLRQGFGWLVGNGKSVDIHKDNWGFEGLNGDAFMCNREQVSEKKVYELWVPDSKRWDRNRVNDIYGETLGDQICNIPIFPHCPNDVLVWFHSHHGTYTTKAAYSWLILKKMGVGPHRLFWKMIWQLKIIPKIRIFAWRVGHEILPTNSKIASIRPLMNLACQRCGADKETLIHALKDCPTARETLMCGGLDDRLVSNVFDRCIDWLEMALRILDKKAMENFITLIWNSWNNRNNFTFRGKEEDANTIWNRALMLSNDFRIHNFSERPMLPIQPTDRKWINVDAAIEEGKMGLGVIVRDEDGFVLGGYGCAELFLAKR
ncbi:hypothetical protein Golax_015047, partial [Gossypium laxum]|nr:hypothetical protein [Gossypium laxum]